MLGPPEPVAYMLSVPLAPIAASVVLPEPTHPSTVLNWTTAVGVLFLTIRAFASPFTFTFPVNVLAPVPRNVNELLLVALPRATSVSAAPERVNWSA